MDKRVDRVKEEIQGQLKDLEQDIRKGVKNTVFDVFKSRHHDTNGTIAYDTIGKRLKARTVLPG